MSTLQRFIKGQPAAGGIVMGTAVVKSATDKSTIKGYAAVNATFTLMDFLHAVEQTRAQLVKFQQNLQERLTESVSQIFSAHLAILDDVEFTGRMRRKIESGTGALEAINAVTGKYAAILSCPSNQILSA